jgi:hypothetical protein
MSVPHVCNVCIADLVPFSHVFLGRRNPKKVPSFFSTARSQPKKRKYEEDMMVVHKLDQKSSHPTSL